MIKGIRFLFYAVLTAIIAILSVGNRGDIAFTLFPLPFEFSMPKYMLMLSFLFMGMILGVLFSYTQIVKRKTETYKLRKEIKELKKKASELENNNAT